MLSLRRNKQQIFKLKTAAVAARRQRISGKNKMKTIKVNPREANVEREMLRFKDGPKQKVCIYVEKTDDHIRELGCGFSEAKKCYFISEEAYNTKIKPYLLEKYGVEVNNNLQEDYLYGFLNDKDLY
jgi:hypothetical protein